MLVAGEYSNRHEVKHETQYAGEIGGLKIHHAPKQTCGQCIDSMQKSRWWDLSPETTLHAHRIAGCCIPYTSTEAATHIRNTAVAYDELKAEGKLLG